MSRKRTRLPLPVWIALGAGIAAGVGATTENMGVYVAFGVGTGAIVGAVVNASATPSDRD